MEDLGQSIEQTEIVGIDQITEPVLQSAKNFLVECLDGIDNQVAQNARLYEAAKGFANRADEVMLPNGDRYVDIEQVLAGVRMLSLISTVAATPEEGVFCTNLTKVTEMVANRWAGDDHELTKRAQDAFARTEEILNNTLKLSFGDPADLAMDLDAVKAMLLPSKRLAEVYPAVAQNDKAAIDEYCSLLEQAPNGGSLGLVVLNSFAVINRFLKDAADDGRAVGLYSHLNKREELKQENGFTDESLRLIEASQILSMVHISVGDRNHVASRRGYWANLVQMLGYFTEASIPLGFGVDGLEWMAKSPATPKNVRQALVAVAATREIVELFASPIYQSAMDNIAFMNDEHSRHLRHEAQMMPKVFQNVVTGFYERVYPAGAEIPDEGVESPLKDQILLLEDIMVTELEARAQHESSQFLSEPARRQLEELLVPRIRLMATVRDTSERLNEIKAFCETTQAQIDHIDKPYLYTSKKIRGFEKGVATLRDIGIELDKRQLLINDDEIRQTLAIILLQAENADDKDLYFMQLKEDRHALEELLGGMSYLGQGGSSRLTDALRWADEVIDAGLDQKFAHQRLKEFLTNYYLGGEDESLEPETVAEPIIEELVEVEPIEEEPAGEAPLKEAETPEERQSLIDEYFAELKDVLENVEVEFSDVEAFPPDQSSKKEMRRVLERASGERFIDLDRNRLVGIVELKAELERMGKSARLIFTHPTKWQRLPYFALYVQENKDDPVGVCFLENAINGLATYAYGVDGKKIEDWEEVVMLASLKTAREVYGATPMVHPHKGASNFMQHYSVRLKQFALQELARVIK